MDILVLQACRKCTNIYPLKKLMKKLMKKMSNKEVKNEIWEKNNMLFQLL